jgi:hypothetical protein
MYRNYPFPTSQHKPVEAARQLPAESVTALATPDPEGPKPYLRAAAKVLVVRPLQAVGSVVLDLARFLYKDVALGNDWGQALILAGLGVTLAGIPVAWGVPLAMLAPAMLAVPLVVMAGRKLTGLLRSAGRFVVREVRLEAEQLASRKLGPKR